MRSGILSGRSALRVVAWTAAVFLGFIPAVLLALVLVDWNSLRGPLARFAGARLHRDVHLNGLAVHVLSRTPSVDIRGLTVGNPNWLTEGVFLHLSTLHIVVAGRDLLRLRLVLDQVQVEQLQLNLVRDKAARANWQFPHADPDASGAQLPPVRKFSLQGGDIDIDDRPHGVRFKGHVVAGEQRQPEVAEQFRLVGNGDFNGEPFALTFSGDPLLNIRINVPYAFRASVAAGATHVQLSGSIDKPFVLGRFEAAVRATGSDLAKLYYLTGLVLPRSPPYAMNLTLSRMGAHFDMQDIVGKVGASDFRGTAAVDMGGQRPLLTATVSSNSLHIRDVGVAFGASTAGDRSALLLPATEFQLPRMQQMDAQVNFHADFIHTGKVPLQTVTVKVALQDGVLHLDPVVLTLPQGRLYGSAQLDSRVHPAAVAVDLHLSGVQLAQFKKKGDSEAPLRGVMASHVTLAGRGKSIHEVAATGQGRLTAVVPHGEIRKALVEFTGIDVLRGLGLVLKGDTRSAAIRCGIAEFVIVNGIAQSHRFVFDTEKVLVEGKGRIELGDESLHLDFTGQPKAFRLIRIRTPINVRGTLAKPSVGIEARHAILQGSAAAAMSVLGPLGSTLAFVDPGLAKDQDCAALLAERADRSQLQ